jgi:hypothetical protein
MMRVLWLCWLMRWELLMILKGWWRILRVRERGDWSVGWEQKGKKAERGREKEGDREQLLSLPFGLDCGSAVALGLLQQRKNNSQSRPCIFYLEPILKRGLNPPIFVLFCYSAATQSRARIFLLLPLCRFTGDLLISPASLEGGMPSADMTFFWTCSLRYLCHCRL